MNFASNVAYVLQTTPSSAMSHSLQEMASRWCHQSVFLVLTIEVNGYVHICILNREQKWKVI